MTTLSPCPQCGSIHKIGVEIQGVYDGVLYWECKQCGWAWQRWTMSTGRWLFDKAQKYIDRKNAPSQSPPK